jgi:hypothetical protein
VTATSSELARKRPAEVTTTQPAPTRAKRQNSPGDVATMTVLRFTAVLFILAGLLGLWLAATGDRL